jgi:hypothetical protein
MIIPRGFAEFRTQNSEFEYFNDLIILQSKPLAAFSLYEAEYCYNILKA